MKYRQELGGWGADPSPQRQGCFVRLSDAVPPLWLLSRGGLEQSPTEVCHCPSLSCGLWAASSHKRSSVPALLPAPSRCLAKATHTGFLPSLGKSRGGGVMAQTHPAPYVPAPSVFQLGLQPRQELHAPLLKPAVLVCKTPKGPTQHFLGALTPGQLISHITCES